MLSTSCFPLVLFTNPGLTTSASISQSFCAYSLLRLLLFQYILFFRRKTDCSSQNTFMWQSHDPNFLHSSRKAVTVRLRFRVIGSTITLDERSCTSGTGEQVGAWYILAFTACWTRTTLIVKVGDHWHLDSTW